MTGLDADSDSLAKLIEITLDQVGLAPEDIGYINSHGTGTQQNDLTEMRRNRLAFGPDLNKVCVSATKSMSGHIVSGAVRGIGDHGAVLRDGFVPPTINHTDPDPECHFDCVPLRGRVNRFQHALSFGGFWRASRRGGASRWNDSQCGFAYPTAGNPPLPEGERRAA